MALGTDASMPCHAMRRCNRLHVCVCVCVCVVVWNYNYIRTVIAAKHWPFEPQTACTITRVVPTGAVQQCLVGLGWWHVSVVRTSAFGWRTFRELHLI